MRKAILKSFLSVFLLLFGITFVCTAQLKTDSISTSAPPYKIGLALSGGGAKGFAHIGILKVFEEEGIPIHRISGTSMGSIVGSLYAIGYTPDEIEQIVLSSDWNILFNDNYRINPKNISNSVSDKDTYLLTFPFNGKRLTLPAGLIDGQNISMMLYRLMLPYHDVQDFSQLPIPFTAVATDLSTGKPHAFTHGYLPDAVRASIAIPTVFKPVTIDGHTYIDGGVSRNIPVEDAFSLGADLVIASDVGEPVKSVDSLKTFVDILFQSVGFHQQESDRRQIEKADFYIRPDIEDFSSFNYKKAKQIVERGEEAARRMVPKIKQYLQDHPTAPDLFQPIAETQNDTLLVRDIQFWDLTGTLRRQAELALELPLPAKLTLSEIERKVNRLYQSGLFSQISYRLQSPSNTNSRGSTLVLDLRPKEQEYVGFSLRYDNKYKAALLFGALLTDNIYKSDRLSAQLRAGEILALNTNYSLPMSLAPLSQINMGLNLQRAPIDYYSENLLLSTIEVEQLSLNPSFSVQFLQKARFETGLEAEIYSLDEAVGNTLFLENTNLLMIPYAEFNVNTLNRPYFPTNGQSLNLRGLLSDHVMGSSSDFLQIHGQWLTTFKLFPGVNFSNTFWAGYSTTSDLPMHYTYYLGGITSNPVFPLHQQSFMGYGVQRLRSSNIASWSSELRFKLHKDIFLSGGVNIAHLADQWTFNIDEDRLKYGYGLELGASTIIGPIRLSLTTPDFSGGYALKIDVGYHF